MAAARALEAFASTVCRCLASLEEALASRLFERTSLGLEAMPAGKSLIVLTDNFEARLAICRDPQRLAAKRPWKSARVSVS